MVFRIALFAATFIVCAVLPRPGASAAEQVHPVPNVAPDFGVAAIGHHGKILIYRYMQRMQSTSREAEVTVGGVKRRIMETHAVPVVEKQVYEIEIEKIKMRRADGTPISQLSLSSLISKPTPVIIVDHGHDIDAVFRQVLRPEALVVLLPHPAATQPVAPPHEQTLPTKVVPLRPERVPR